MNKAIIEPIENKIAFGAIRDNYIAYMIETKDERSWVPNKEVSVTKIDKDLPKLEKIIKGISKTLLECYSWIGDSPFTIYLEDKNLSKIEIRIIRSKVIKIIKEERAKIWQMSENWGEITWIHGMAKEQINICI